LAVDMSAAMWRKSSFSNGTGGNCVEVASNLPGVVAVRDSKDREGPALIFMHDQWRTLLADTRSGQLDLLA
jgi:hypothetical protein